MKTQVAPLPSTIEAIDKRLSELSDIIKVVSLESRDLYVRRANKLLDKRNKLTNA